jgi:nucleotidyltransferase substrate binding protein (TIGR01987 family)
MSDRDELRPHLDSFASALKRLAAALAQPKSEWTRDAAIQRFELTFELAWKSTARAARREGIECASPRQAFRAAVKLGWIADEPLWLDMLDDRNRASHTYNEQTAEEIFSRLPEYRSKLDGLLERLRMVAADAEDSGS